MQIIEVFGREILDSRGNPTIEVEVTRIPALSALLPFRPALPPVRTRPSSSVTAVPAIAARVFSRL